MAVRNQYTSALDVSVNAVIQTSFRMTGTTDVLM